MPTPLLSLTGSSDPWIAIDDFLNAHPASTTVVIHWQSIGTASDLEDQPRASNVESVVARLRSPSTVVIVAFEGTNDLTAMQAALAADGVVCAPDAAFVRHDSADVGTLLGVADRAHAIIGAWWRLLAGERLTGVRAFELGLADVLDPLPVERSLAWANQIATIDRGVLAETKALLTAVENGPALRRLERDALTRLTSNDTGG